MQIKEIVRTIEQFAPPALQESYDNAGLIVGDAEKSVSSALITVDVTEDVVDEAIEKDAGLIISHHPVIFGGLKKLTGRTYVERIVLKAIKHDIALFSAHTNLDKTQGGVNFKIAEKLALQNVSILMPEENQLLKLVYFVPKAHVEKTRKAVFEAGAGSIGQYDECSYNLEGTGTFRAGDAANPFVGDKGVRHEEQEIRVETILPSYLKATILSALINAHPYEEVAYDLYPLENSYHLAGLGVIGDLSKPADELSFLTLLKERFQAKGIRYTALRNKPVKRVAICGGSGASFLSAAISQRADIYVSADFKYHQFFDADGKIVIADVGHYETEQVTKELFYDLLSKKFPKFALYLSERNSNPINYL
ncbi:MAG: Nif3-like dinuclear metal center hexameric protein [Bacteroidales bacterium]